MTFTLLAHHLLGHHGGQRGGRKEGGDPMSTLYVLAVVMVILLVKAYIVQWTWNRVVPVLLNSLHPSPTEAVRNFRELNYVDALILTVLSNCLFS